MKKKGTLELKECDCAECTCKEKEEPKVKKTNKPDNKLAPVEIDILTETSALENVLNPMGYHVESIYLSKNDIITVKIVKRP